MVVCIPRLIAVVVSLKRYAVPLLLYMRDKKANTAVCTGIRQVKAKSTYIVILRAGGDSASIILVSICALVLMALYRC